jgi:acyl dehydratase
VTDWAGVAALRSFSCRFMSVTLLGERLECAGLVTGVRTAGCERLADLDLTVRNQAGEVKLQGSASVVLNNGG